MAISHKDASVSIGFRSLDVEEGFVITFSASLGSQVPQNAKNKAHKEGITGQRLHAHRKTLPEVIQTITDESNAFASELTTFITEWNNEHTD